MKPTANPADMLPVNGMPKFEIANTVASSLLESWA
jgi:hypothetical protein